MFDTIKARHNVEPRPIEELRERGPWQAQYHRSTRELTKLVLNRPRYRLTWGHWRDTWFLSVECSLPKLWFGENVSMVMGLDIPFILLLISDFVAQDSGVTFDTDTAVITRLDACYNFRDDEANIGPRIAALFHWGVPRMEAHAISGPKGTSVQFSDGTGKILVYDKRAEVVARGGTAEEVARASGVLRVERRIDDSHALTRLAQKYGVGRQAHSLITEKVGLSMMEDVVKRLGLDKPAPSHDGRFDALNRCYGPVKAANLMRYVHLLNTYGPNFYEHPNVKGYSRSTYYAHSRLCRAANVGLASPQQQALPALELAWPPAMLEAAA